MELTTATRASEAAAKQVVRDLREVLNCSICLEMTHWIHKMVTSDRSSESTNYSIYETSINKLHKFNTWNELMLFYFDIMENR